MGNRKAIVPKPSERSSRVLPSLARSAPSRASNEADAFIVAIDRSTTIDVILRELSPRERQVLKLFLTTPSDKDVARQLGTRPHTVQNQLASIQEKLGADTREDLLVKVFGAWIRAHLCIGNSPIDSAAPTDKLCLGRWNDETAAPSLSRSSMAIPEPFCRRRFMANPLAKFMTKLAQEPGALKAFKDDPHGSMVGEGLNSEDIAAVLSKRPDLIRSRLGGASRAAADSDVTVVVVVL